MSSEKRTPASSSSSISGSKSPSSFSWSSGKAGSSSERLSRSSDGLEASLERSFSSTVLRDSSSSSCSKSPISSSADEAAPSSSSSSKRVSASSPSSSKRVSSSPLTFAARFCPATGGTVDSSPIKGISSERPTSSSSHSTSTPLAESKVAIWSASSGLAYDRATTRDSMVRSPSSSWPFPSSCCTSREAYCSIRNFFSSRARI